MVRLAATDLLSPIPDRPDSEVKFISMAFPQFGQQKCPIATEQDDRVLARCNNGNMSFFIDRMQVR